MKVLFHTVTFESMLAQWGRVQLLGFGYLAAALRRKFPDIEIRLADTEDELLALAASPATAPDVVGLTCVTFTYNQARRLAVRIREAAPANQRPLVVVGGPHVTALPESLGPEFDCAVLGEGEETICELIECVRQASTDFSMINGLAWRPSENSAFRNSHSALINPPRPLIEPIDSIPHPDREIFNRNNSLRRASISLMTSRGCPYDCTFCATTKHWQRIRIHSAGYVMEELDEVITRYRPWKIVFEDDLFLADRKRLQAVIEGILRRGYHKRTRFHVNGRANLVNEELCALLRSINCESMFIGFESASDRVLAALGKKNVTAEVNQRAIDLLRRHGIGVVASFIIGAPGETFDEMRATFDFARRNLDAFVRLEASPLRLFPGTAMWDLGLSRGLIDDALTGIILEEEDFRDGWGHLSRRMPYLDEAATRAEMLGMFLAFEELSALVRERRENPRHVGNMSLRALAREFGLKILNKLFKNIP